MVLASPPLVAVYCPNPNCRRWQFNVERGARYERRCRDCKHCWEAVAC